MLALGNLFLPQLGASLYWPFVLCGAQQWPICAIHAIHYAAFLTSTQDRICTPAHLLSILVAGDSPVGNFLPESSPEEPLARVEWRKRPRLRVSQLSGPVGVQKTSSLSIWISSSLELGAWRPNHQKGRVGSHLIVQSALSRKLVGNRRVQQRWTSPEVTEGRKSLSI